MLMKYEVEMPRIKGGEGGQKERVPIKQRSDGSLGCQRRLSKIMSNRAHSEVIGHWLLTNWTDLTSGTPLSEFPGAPEKIELQRSLPKRETEFQRRNPEFSFWSGPGSEDSQLRTQNDAWRQNQSSI